MNEVTKAALKFTATILVGATIGAAVGLGEIRYKRNKDIKHANMLAALAHAAATHILEVMANDDNLDVQLYAIQRKIEIKCRRIEYPFSSKDTYDQVGNTIDMIIDAAVEAHKDKAASV